ncbi:MAG: response regulator [Nitrososphaeraceae archaeon]|jgi:two-component system, OmpR family, response regulator ChvI
MATEEISFLNESDSYCVCFIDMIGSTKVISQIATVPEKIRNYYSIFLNSMSAIIKKHGGIIIKNIGDSLIFYFPKTSDSTNRSAFWNVIDCCVTMMAAYRFVNLEMSKMGLPPVNYRISADYGKAIIAKSASSLTYDLFGPVLDVCSKINSKAPPNGMVIGNDLYQVFKSFFLTSSTSSSADDYNFKMIEEHSIVGSKQSYPLYSVTSKYTNYNTSTTTTIQHTDSENMPKLQKEKQEKERDQLSQQQENKSKNNILLIDDEPDIVFTYKSILNEEGYNVHAFTDPRQALRHFSQLDPLYYKLILLDVRMPNANGFQLYYKFKAMNPNVKIIFVTALDVMGEELASMLPGFSAEHDLIKKPLNKDQYINKIKSVLSI